MLKRVVQRVLLALSGFAVACDGCCHLRPAAYILVARAIGDAIRADAADLP